MSVEMHRCPVCGAHRSWARLMAVYDFGVPLDALSARGLGYGRGFRNSYRQVSPEELVWLREFCEAAAESISELLGQGR